MSYHVDGLNLQNTTGLNKGRIKSKSVFDCAQGAKHAVNHHTMTLSIQMHLLAETVLLRCNLTSTVSFIVPITFSFSAFYVFFWC